MRLEEVISSSKGKNIISNGRRLKEIEKIVKRNRENLKNKYRANCPSEAIE